VIKVRESNILLYETEDGKVNVDVILKDETIWLTQKSRNSTTEIFSVVRKEGNREFYNLDNIIAVGYRVISKKATKFRCEC
jgi:hypothetical protein